VKDTVEWLAAEADESEELSGDHNPRLVSAKSAETRTGHPDDGAPSGCSFHLWLGRTCLIMSEGGH
jgi:hypothetical protein